MRKKQNIENFMSQLRSEVSYYTTFLYRMSKHTFFSNFLNFSRFSFRLSCIYLFVPNNCLFIFIINNCLFINNILLFIFYHRKVPRLWLYNDGCFVCTHTQMDGFQPSGYV